MNFKRPSRRDFLKGASAATLSALAASYPRAVWGDGAPSPDMYGPGANPWVKKYGEDTAKLVSRFKADDYQPRNDGWVTVKQPRAQFFLNFFRKIFQLECDLEFFRFLNIDAI